MLQFSSLHAMVIQNLIGLLFSLSCFIPLRSNLLGCVGEESFKFYSFSVLNLIKTQQFYSYCPVVCSHHPMTPHNVPSRRFELSVVIRISRIGTDPLRATKLRGVWALKEDTHIAYLYNLVTSYRFFFFATSSSSVHEMSFSILLLREFPRGPEWCNGCRQFGTNFD